MPEFFYRGLRPSIEIKPLDPANARVGLTLNRYLSADYASNATKTNRMQRALIQAVARREKNRLYSQGEREETLAIYETGEEKAETHPGHPQQIRPDGRQGRRSLDERSHAGVFFDVDEWAADAKKNVDVLVGFRLHGNVIGLHQGIPAVFFTYDLAHPGAFDPLRNSLGRGRGLHADRPGKDFSRTRTSPRCSMSTG
ncbi:polysaccharide pyruvyl transferase family protein [Roseibium salinum]|nr:polysaccharide pyruvyl transferase family protein [Roseibium salinum]